MASIGEILRRERDRQGMTLATIAQQTRIKLQFLEALEKDQYNQLPGRFFVRSFALQYAEKLGINTDELLVAIQRHSGESTALSPVRTEEPRLGSLFPERPALDPLPEGTASLLNAKKLAHSVAMLASVITVCGLLFWLWQTQLGTTSAETNKPQAKQAVPETVSPPAAQPNPPAVQTSETPAPSAPPAAEPQTNQAAAVVPEKTEVPPQAPAAPASKINLVVTASDRTWVRITVDNRIQMERLMLAGESETAAGNSSARILTGSAGALGVRFNGADIGSLGPKGQVQTVDFTPGGFQMQQAYRSAAGSPTQSASPAITARPGLN